MQSPRSSLHRLLTPRSVAVVGASRTPEKYGYMVPRYLLEGGYQGQVFLINPRAGEALGHRFSPSLQALDQPVDLVVSVLPPANSLAVVEDAVKIGAGGVVLLAAGFAEASSAGASAQADIARVASNGGVRLVGPNCLGVFNASSRLNVMANPDIPPGSVALVSQSGGLAEMFFHEARRLGGGLSLCVSIGNQADVRLEEVIEFAARDPATTVIAVYAEGTPDGRLLIEAVARATQSKPVVVVKGGRGRAGSRATISHTASIAGRADIWDELLDNAGAIVCRELGDFYSLALSLAWCPEPRGTNIALVGGGGGAGTVMADYAERQGLEVPELPQALQRRLRALLSPNSNVSNPIEFAGASEDSLSVYERCAEAVLEHDVVDGLVVFGSFGGFRPELENEFSNYTVSAKALGQLVRRHDKPVIVQSYHSGRALDAFETLKAERIPSFASPETAIRCMAATASRKLTAAGRHRPAAAQHRPAAAATTLLGFEQGRALFDAAALDVVPARYATGPVDGLEAAARIGYPVVLKLLEPILAHKSDEGAVATGIQNEQELKSCIRAMLAIAERLGCQRGEATLGVFPHIRAGVEAVVGAVRDATFGPLVMVGSGGIYLETYHDVAWALAGLSIDTAGSLIQRTRLSRVLRGKRGGRALDVESLARVVVAVSDVMVANPGVLEIDLNPVFVQQHRTLLADLRVVEAM